jgi:tubulin monoglycylase TTLL15
LLVISVREFPFGSYTKARRVPLYKSTQLALHVLILQGVTDLDLSQEGSFVQEFVHNPLLIDGYKFDIGIYTTLTSVDPLRSVSL